MLKYTKDHEWVRLEGDLATVGITSYAQDKLGDLVFVELPSIGASFGQGAPAAVVELVKAASDVYTPMTGEVVAVNEKLGNEPGLVNTDPTGEGWLFRIKVADKREIDTLLDEAGYQAILE